MPSEDAFVTGAVQGTLIAIAFAFLILLVATSNIIISLIAIFCIAIINCSIVGTIHMNGQQLGISESISVVALIGFSVDYIVHLAADYVHS